MLMTIRIAARKASKVPYELGRLALMSKSPALADLDMQASEVFGNKPRPEIAIYLPEQADVEQSQYSRPVTKVYVKSIYIIGGMDCRRLPKINS